MGAESSGALQRAQELFRIPNPESRIPAGSPGGILRVVALTPEDSMRNRTAKPLLVLVLGLFVAGVSLAGQAQPQQTPLSPVFPGQEWEKIARPEDAGYSTARLGALKSWLESIDTTAMVASVGGRVLFEYGDVKHLSYLASVRKSVLALLYGKYVENGTIKLDRTLKDLEFTDVDGLLPLELRGPGERFGGRKACVFA